MDRFLLLSSIAGTVAPISAGGAARHPYDSFDTSDRDQRFQRTHFELIG